MVEFSGVAKNFPIEMPARDSRNFAVMTLAVDF
jgi:hypothetical protein